MATCEQLAQTSHMLNERFTHVHDPDMKAEIARQLNEIRAQMRREGCLESTARQLNGMAILCASSVLPGARSAPISLLFHITNWSGEASCTFAPLSFGSATVSLPPQQAGIAHFNPASMVLLDAHVPLRVTGIPVVGELTTEIALSTTTTLDTPCGQFAGQPQDPGGTVALVGSTSISVLLTNIAVQLRIVGTLVPLHPPPA